MGATMLLTLHDLASVAGGGALMCGMDDGGEGLLRLAGTPVDPQSLAEKRTYDDDLPALVVTKDDIGVMLHGGTIMTYGAAGTIQARMMTTDELLEAHAAACTKYGGAPSMTREQAAELTRTL